MEKNKVKRLAANLAWSMYGMIIILAFTMALCIKQGDYREAMFFAALAAINYFAIHRVELWIVTLEANDGSNNPDGSS